MLTLLTPANAIIKILYDGKYRVEGNPFKYNSEINEDDYLKSVIDFLKTLTPKVLEDIHTVVSSKNPDNIQDVKEYKRFIDKKVYMLRLINNIFKTNNLITKDYVSERIEGEFLVIRYYDLYKNVYEIQVSRFERDDENDNCDE